MPLATYPPLLFGAGAPKPGVDPDPTSGGVVNASACFAAYDACNFMAIMPYELTGTIGERARGRGRGQWRGQIAGRSVRVESNR